MPETPPVRPRATIRVPIPELGETVFKRGGRYSGQRLSEELGITGNSTLWVWVNQRGVPVEYAVEMAEKLDQWSQELAEAAVTLRERTGEALQEVEATLNRLRGNRQEGVTVGRVGLPDDPIASSTNQYGGSR